MINSIGSESLCSFDVCCLVGPDLFFVFWIGFVFDDVAGRIGYNALLFDGWDTLFWLSLVFAILNLWFNQIVCYVVLRFVEEC